MAKVSKETASEVMAVDGYEGRTQDLGGYTVAYETFTSDQDPAPLFVGLPDDHCQCPHWGYVVSGRVRVRYADREEVLSAGDLYYMPPGHTTFFEEPTELVEFSPQGEYARTIEVAARNMAAMQG